MEKILLGQSDDEVFGSFTQSPIFESKQPMTEEQIEDQIVEAAANTLRSEAMGVALTWIEEGEHTFDAIDYLVEGIVTDEGEEDQDLTPDEIDHYDLIMEIMPAALKSLGGNAENIAKLLDHEDDEAGAALGKHLTSKLDETAKDDDDLVAEFAAGGEMILESLRMVRGGEVVRKSRKRRKRRMTSAQRAALKKARRKAHTSAARRARKKSMKVRSKRGL